MSLSNRAAQLCALMVLLLSPPGATAVGPCSAVGGLLAASCVADPFFRRTDFPSLKAHPSSITFLAEAPEEHRPVATLGDVRPMFFIADSIVRQEGYSAAYFARWDQAAPQTHPPWLSYLDDVGYTRARGGIVDVSLPFGDDVMAAGSVVERYFQASCGAAGTHHTWESHREALKKEGAALQLRVTDYEFAHPTSSGEGERTSPRILRLVHDVTDWMAVLRTRFCPCTVPSTEGSACSQIKTPGDFDPDGTFDAGYFKSRQEMVAGFLANPEAPGSDLVSLLGLTLPQTSAGGAVVRPTHHCLLSASFRGPSWLFKRQRREGGIGLCQAGELTIFNFGDQFSSGQNKKAVHALTAQLVPLATAQFMTADKDMHGGPVGTVLPQGLPAMQELLEDLLKQGNHPMTPEAAIATTTTICVAFSLPATGSEDLREWFEAFRLLKNSPPAGFRLVEVNAGGQETELFEAFYRTHVCDIVYTTGGMASVASVLQFGALPISCIGLAGGTGNDKTEIKAQGLENPDWSKWDGIDHVTTKTRLTAAVGCAKPSVETLKALRDETDARDAAKKVAKYLKGLADIRQDGQSRAANIAVERANNNCAGRPNGP